ncbi:MAG: hydrogenase [Betaproteobacteria bacterium]|nr:hydrogenase [Betaproteobacteria bacterium]
MNAIARPTPTEPPLITSLVNLHGAVRLDEASFDAFLATPGEAVLFFTEDPIRFREVTDLAVILPEIRAAASRPFRIGVLPPPIANAKAATYGVRRWPALVFLRDGHWLGNIEALRDWSEYVSLANGLLESETRPLPPKVIPVAAAGAGSCA